MTKPNKNVCAKCGQPTDRFPVPRARWDERWLISNDEIIGEVWRPTTDSEFWYCKTLWQGYPEKSGPYNSETLAKRAVRRMVRDWFESLEREGGEG